MQYRFAANFDTHSIYYLGRAVLESGGTVDIPNIASARGSPLAKLLFRYLFLAVFLPFVQGQAYI